MNHAGTDKYVADLAELFREQGPQLYSGEHTLCLTTSCLHSLQKKFASLRELSVAKPIPAKLARLRDICECLYKIKKLKLISDRKTVAPSLVNIDLSQFRDLQTLVLKRVRINTLTGLQRLREQLQVLKIQRSHLSSLEEVLVQCGSDNAQAFSWSSLKELDLSGNQLKALGECLNYLPQVQRVDFSNNRIGNGVRNDRESSYNSDYGSINSADMSGSTEETSQSLEGLQLADSVEWLHLGFNLLTSPPALGDRAKFNLKVLILRDNQLKSIAGLEMLERLVELDLCNNLLSQHSELRPLKRLHFLRSLSLSGNPLCYDPRHRILTAFWLTDLVTIPAAADFLLDSKKLSSNERKALAGLQPDRSPTPSSTTSGTPTPASSLARLFIPKRYSSLSPSVVSMPVDTPSTTRPIYAEPFLCESDEVVNLRSLPGTPAVPHQALSRRKKAREVSFDNEEARGVTTTHLDSDSITVVPPVNKDRILKYQDLRKQLDNAWLTSALSSSTDGLEASGTCSPPQKGRAAKHRGSKRRRLRKSCSPLSQDRVPSSGFLSSSFSGQGALPVPSRAEGRDRLPESFLDEARPPSSGGGVPRPGSSPRPGGTHSHSPVVGSSGAKSPSQVIAANSGYSIIHVPSDREDPYLDEPTQADVEGVQPSPPLQKGLDGLLAEEEPILEENQGSKEQYSEGEKGPSPDELEEKYAVEVWDSGTEEDGHCDTVFLSISDKFLQEIDATNGDLMDQVDLKCLRSVSVDEKTWREKDKSRVLVLHFSHVRRDRKRREYLLVEDSDERSILERLEPVVERNRSIASTATKLECLKCQRIISISEAVDVAESPVSLATAMWDTSSPSDWSGARLRKLCPFCREPFLMLLDVEPSMNFHSTPSVIEKSSPHRQDAPGNQRSTQPLTTRPPHLSAVTTTMTYTDSSSGCGQTDSGGGNTARSPSPSPLDLSYSYRDYVAPSTTAGIRHTLLAHSQDSPVGDVSPFVYQAGKPAAKNRRTPSNHDNGSHAACPHPHRTRPIDAQHLSPDVANGLAYTTETGREQPELETRLPHDNSHHGYHPHPSPSPCADLLVAESKAKGPLDSFDPHISTASSSSSRIQSDSGDKQPFADLIGDPESLWAESEEGWSRGHATDSPSPGNRSARPRPSNASGRKDDFVDGREEDDDDEEGNPFAQEGDTVSSSFPSESRLRSYFFGSRERSRKDEKKKEKSGVGKMGHSRSHSAGYVNKKVPPLPPDMIQQQRARIDPRDSLGKRHDGSQISIESAHSDSMKNEDDRPGSLGTDQQASSGSSEERRSSGRSAASRFGRFAVGLRRGSKKAGPVVAMATKPQRPASPVIPYRDDDPTYLHNNFTLYLDMEVFDVDRQEHFKLAFKSPMITYGDWKEIDSFLIVSDRKAYLYRVTAPESIQPPNWLELVTTLPLKDIVYIDIGVGYQSLRLEIKNPPQCYTFLVRQEQKCRKFFDKLSYVVSDVSRPSLKSIGVAQFSVEDIRNPSKALREAILYHYDRLSPSRTRSSRRDELKEEAEQLEMFLLAHHHQPACEPAQVPVTFILTNLHIYLGMANPQWPLPKLHPLPDREDLMPPFSAVTCKDVTDVERMVLYDDQPYQFTLQFFTEDATPSSDPPTWTMILKDVATVQKFIKRISQIWEKEFQHSFPIGFQ